MEPARADEPQERGVSFDKPSTTDGISADDVGAFEQGNEFSRWALARYIVGRVILERISWGLLGVALVLLVLAGLAEWVLHSTALAVVLVVLTLSVLLMRALLRGLLRRLMAFSTFAPVEDRIKKIIDDASGDIFAELGRVGLPSHIITLPLFIPRLLGRRRRADTMARIRRFEVERAVTRAHRDELHLALRQATGGRRV